MSDAARDEAARELGAGLDRTQRGEHGSAHESWRAMIAGQGGEPDQPLPTAPHIEEVLAGRGWPLRLDACDVATVARAAGTNRERKEHSVDPAAGVELLSLPARVIHCE